MHKVKTQRFGVACQKHAYFLFLYGYNKTYKVKKKFFNKFRKDYNKFPETFRLKFLNSQP